MSEAVRLQPQPEGPKSGESPIVVPTPAVGTLVNGKYLIEKVIGEGGVGVVVAAQNTGLGERVALKFLKSEMLARQDVVDRFMHEAKAACSIKSEHSATVFDVGRTAKGVPFLVMEFLEGSDLGAAIAQGPLPVREVAEYAMQVCEALAVAHAKGIVHRDIKPENLFLETRGGMRSVKVLDFGISKSVLTGGKISFVRSDDLMGTPVYMSPEQIRAADSVDPRTDIWSLGVVMFEALTGQLPLQASSITELCAAILESPLDSLTQHRTDLPDGLVEVVEKCLEKDISRRYQSVAELAIALLPYAPKRCRLSAERAGQVLVAAGVITEDSVRFPSSMPPPSSTTGPNPAFELTGLPLESSGAFGRLSGVPQEATPSEASAVEAPISEAEISTRPSLIDPADIERRVPSRTSKGRAIAIAVVLLGLGGAAFALYRHQTAPVAAPAAVTTAAPQAPPPAAVEPAPPPPVVDPTPPVVQPSTPAHTAGAAPIVRGVMKPPVQALPAARPSAKAAAAPVVPPPPRPGPAPKKANSADSIDLGY